MSSSSAPVDAIKAITESLPPASDYMTYLTILESHLSPDILPRLNDILQDAELTQNIGWDLVHLLLPLPGGEKCLDTVARLGNPREVVLKVTEALELLKLEAGAESREEGEEDIIQEKAESARSEPTNVDKFCILLNLLSTLHPRIKTKYPSRFLSTSLMAVLAAFRPSNQATLAVISFVHTISGKKRPPLPGRKSSANLPVVASGPQAEESAPDPEAQDEDPREAAIQQKLLQSFVSHVLEDYVNSNSLEWSARLQESFDPTKVVTGRRSLGKAYREDPDLQSRDIIVGQLVALAKDLGLSSYEELLAAIYKREETLEDEEESEENYPTSPDDIPLAQAGSLFLITCFVFSSVLFESKAPQPALSIFPDHTKLVKHFIGTAGPATIGSEAQGTIDAILAIGLWLEHNNQFVSGPLEDDEFLQHLQSLSLLSANTPSPTLRYAAHVLTSSILHAHPVDRLRLTFISDTLEHCPYETLKGSAVSWLKEEIITAKDRKSENVFGTTTALAAAQPYLFPDTSALADATEEELEQELAQSFPYHMAVVNFIYFISADQYAHLVPPGMITVIEEIYLGPLRDAQAKSLAALDAADTSGKGEIEGSATDLRLLGDRIALCSIKADN
ncbi:YAP-binding/ALF4/Glomulin [Tricladium varicosporioides]|nr:YAP-binding/ALF4/Glomulin [Hymenoscyphus varicosporioides]